MQNVAQGSTADNQKLDKLNTHEVGKSSTPQSSNSSPTKSESETFSELVPRYMSDSSESEDEDVSEVKYRYVVLCMLSISVFHANELCKDIL